MSGVRIRSASRGATKSARLEARVSPEAKALCAKAAEIQGTTLTEFVVNCALETARRTVKENELSELTRRDRIEFVEALLSPPAPSEKLRRAAARHAQIFQD